MFSQSDIRNGTFIVSIMTQLYIFYNFKLYLETGFIVNQFGYSCIASISLVSNRLGWEWSCNVLIYDWVWGIFQQWSQDFNAVHSQTIAILICLLGESYIFGLIYKRRGL